MLNKVQIMQRRTKIESILEAEKGKPISIRMLGLQLGVASHVVKYDIEWLRKYREMVIRHDQRDIVVFERKQVNPLDPSVSERGRGMAYPMLGLCDVCSKVITLTGRRRFCSDDCRATWGDMNAHTMRVLMTEKVGLINTFPGEATVKPDINQTREALTELDQQLKELINRGEVPSAIDLDSGELNRQPTENENRDLVSDLDIVKDRPT